MYPSMYRSAGFVSHKEENICRIKKKDNSAQNDYKNTLGRLLFYETEDNFIPVIKKQVSKFDFREREPKPKNRNAQKNRNTQNNRNATT